MQKREERKGLKMEERRRKESEIKIFLLGIGGVSGEPLDFYSYFFPFF